MLKYWEGGFFFFFFSTCFSFFMKLQNWDTQDRQNCVPLDDVFFHFLEQRSDVSFVNL